MKKDEKIEKINEKYTKIGKKILNFNEKIRCFIHNKLDSLIDLLLLILEIIILLPSSIFLRILWKTNVFLVISKDFISKWIYNMTHNSSKK